MSFNYDPEVDNAAYLHKATPTDDFAQMWESDWNAAEVVWDGVSYTVVPQYFQGLKCAGNMSMVNGTGDDGIPFFIMYVQAGIVGDTATLAIYAVYDPIEGTTEESTGEDGTVTTTTTYPTISHTVGITLRKTVIHKIPGQYQHQVDWDETDESSAAYTKNKPFGKMLPDGAVLADLSAVYDPDFCLMLCDINTGESYIDVDLVKEGVTYYIEVNGYTRVGEYVTGEDALNAYGGSASQGITADAGIVAYDDNGEPEMVVILGLAGIIHCIKPMDTSAFTAGESYPVKITVASSIKKLDRQYIPGPPEFDLTAMGLPALTMDGSNVSVECDTSELITAFGEGVVKVAFTVNTGSAEAACGGILNAFWTADGYYYACFIGLFNGAPMMLNFTVTTSGISGQIIPLATTTT